MALRRTDEPMSTIHADWNTLKKKWLVGDALDPAFEGMVKDFYMFDVTMKDITEKVEIFMMSMDNLSKGVLGLTQSVIAGLAHLDDPLLGADCYQLQEAASQICRADASHSAISKMRSDIDFSILSPTRLHLFNNLKLKAQLDTRGEMLLELQDAKKRSSREASEGLSDVKLAFHELDRQVFEWLYILAELRGEILDSMLQTLKYILYEFLSTSSHAMSRVLPRRVDFRPMVEMTPEGLEDSVWIARIASGQAAMDGTVTAVPFVTDFTKYIADKVAAASETLHTRKEEEEAAKQTEAANAPAVDHLSLSSLLEHGFEDAPARWALKLHQNNAQAALEWLVDGGADRVAFRSSDRVYDVCNVRFPSTVKYIQAVRHTKHTIAEAKRTSTRLCSKGRLHWRWLSVGLLSPDFKEQVRNFSSFVDLIQGNSTAVAFFMQGVEDVCRDLLTLSDAVTTPLFQAGDPLITSHGCEFKQAANTIARGDAPHSALAKLRRDMEHNLTHPLRLHLARMENLKALVAKRDRLLVDLRAAQREPQSSEQNLTTKATVEKMMNFAPLVEMTPDHLAVLVHMELQATNEGAKDGAIEEPSVGYGQRLVNKIAKEATLAEALNPNEASGNVVSLSSLLSMGFPEGRARQAIELYQSPWSAIEWLVDGEGSRVDGGGGRGDGDASSVLIVQDDGEGPRIPVTAKRIQKLKAKRRVKQDWLKRRILASLAE